MAFICPLNCSFLIKISLNTRGGQVSLKKLNKVHLKRCHFVRIF